MLDVVIVQGAGAEVRRGARDLADYLTHASGAPFKVVTGDGSTGIMVGTGSDFKNLPFDPAFTDTPFERDVYVVKSMDRALYLPGVNRLSTQFAVWDFLYCLDYRQFFPGLAAVSPDELLLLRARQETADQTKGAIR